MALDWEPVKVTLGRGQLSPGLKDEKEPAAQRPEESRFQGLGTASERPLRPKQKPETIAMWLEGETGEVRGAPLSPDLVGLVRNLDFIAKVMGGHWRVSRKGVT